MYSDAKTSAIMSTGMKLLRENLGVIATEIFITTISSNNFDYTKWRENLWEDLTLRELLEHAAEVEGKYGVPDGVQIV